MMEDDGGTLVEKVAETSHRCNSVEKETNEMWKYDMGDAVESPWTMMVHFENAPTAWLTYKTDVF